MAHIRVLGKAVVDDPYREKDYEHYMPLLLSKQYPMQCITHKKPLLLSLTVAKLIHYT
jgi:hypothetical protein